MNILIPPPQTITELLNRANMLTGHTLGELAAIFDYPIPVDLSRHKGWTGNFIEELLGAEAGSKPTQDFINLNVELKTIPIGDNGTPLETTFVALAPLTGNIGLEWSTSHVRKKLQQVLWITVQGNRNIPLKDRQVGLPILWSPSAEQEQILKNDWEELTELITLGKYNEINAKIGIALQLRPKGANRLSRTEAFNENGDAIKSLPLGFYLRNQFTQQIITNYIASQNTLSK